MREKFRRFCVKEKGGYSSTWCHFFAESAFLLRLSRPHMFTEGFTRMPCACVIPAPNYPDSADWGPILWSILHGLAEKAGSGSLAADEIREWLKFLKITGEMLPCEKCRDHYLRYSKANPLTHLQTVPYSALKTAVKTWLWTLHNEVNTENGKAAFAYDDLTAKYQNVNFQDLFWRLDPVMKKAVQLNGASYQKYTTWIYSFKMLRSILSV
jgi:hypothetical protein